MTRHGMLAVGSTVLTIALAAALLPEVRQLVRLPRELLSREPDRSSSPVTVPVRHVDDEPVTRYTPVEGSLGVRSVRASSTLPPSRVARYAAEMAIDGIGATPWVENAPGPGIGEWIELDLGSPRTVTRLEVSNGYDKDVRYGENGRVRAVTLRFSGGETRTFPVEDRPGVQSLSVGSVRTSMIRLVIDATYPGSRWEDTALGEVRVFGY